VTLTCSAGGCPGGGPDIFSGASPFTNAGTITVGGNTGGGAVVGGAIANTGTIAFQQGGSLSGVVVNQGTITVADGATVVNQGSSCGDLGASVKNDAGGQIDGGATGILSVRNFEQGAGVTKDVQVPCGTIERGPRWRDPRRHPGADPDQRLRRLGGDRRQHPLPFLRQQRRRRLRPDLGQPGAPMRQGLLDQ
jgi:hypothetical protein